MPTDADPILADELHALKERVTKAEAALAQLRADFEAATAPDPETPKAPTTTPASTPGGWLF